MWRCLQLTFLRRFCSTICVNKFSARSTFSILCTFFFHFSTVRVCIVTLYCTCPQLYTFLWQFLYRLFTLPSFPSCFPFGVELCKNETTQIKVCGWIPGSAISLSEAVSSHFLSPSRERERGGGVLYTSPVIGFNAGFVVHAPTIANCSSKVITMGAWCANLSRESLHGTVELSIHGFNSLPVFQSVALQSNLSGLWSPGYLQRTSPNS